MAITFNCGACGKSLTTTDDKAGRKAKCPGCGEVVTVPGNADADAGDAGAEDELEEDFDELPARTTRVRDTGSKTCPMCGAENPRKAESCSACGEKFEPVEDEDEPGRRRSQIIDPGEVISASWTIYKNDLGVVLGSVIVAILVQTAAGIPAQVFNVMAQFQAAQGQDPSGMIGMSYLMQIPSYLVGWFMNIGVAKVLFKVARGKEAEIGEIFSGGKFFLKMLGATIVFAIMATIGFLLCIIPGIIVSLMFWPYVFVLIDENPDGIDCLWRSKDITQGNWGSVFILFLAAFGINLLGMLALCVGLIFTIPLTQLMMAVAYCHMTGRRTAE